MTLDPKTLPDPKLPVEAEKSKAPPGVPILPDLSKALEALKDEVALAKSDRSKTQGALEALEARIVALTEKALAAGAPSVASEGSFLAWDLFFGD